jgi:hypothetical protein
MSDQDLIAPPFIDEEDMEVSDESLSDDSRDPPALPPLLPLPDPQPQRQLSTYLTQVDKYIEGLTAKKLQEAIVRVDAANPNVYQFKKGEKVPSIVKARNDGAAGKKLRNKWQDLRYDFLLCAKLRNGSHVFGYATSGKDDSLAQHPVTDPARFVMVPAPNLAMFHAPDFDPAKYYTATQQDQRTVSLQTQDGVVFSSVNFDPRLIIRHAKLAESTRSKKSGTVKSATAPNRKADAAMAKKQGDSGDLGIKARTASLAHLLALQRASNLSDVPVVMGQSPHYTTLQSLLGPERFPLLRSEDTDGLHMLPYDIGGDLRASMECFVKLAFLGTSLTEEAANVSRAGQWGTETILRALLILQMAPQFATLPGVSFLRSRGMALSETNIAGVMKDFENADDSHALIARALAQFTSAQLIFDELTRLNHPVLKTAVPLLAFATCALRLGELRVEQFHPGTESNPPILKCALTGMAIVPGMPFYMLRAKSRPTAALPTGQAMIAIVAKSVDDPFMCLYAVRPSCSFLSFSPSVMQAVTKPAPADASAKAQKAAPTAKKTPEQIQAARAKKNEQARERRRQKKEEEEAAGRGPSSSPPPTPVPSPRKVKKRIVPEEEANTKKTKKSRVASADDDGNAKAPYLGTSPILDAAGYVLYASPVFHALANFATIDPLVNQAMAVFLARVPVRYDPKATPDAAFKTWVDANQAILVQLSSVFKAFVKKKTALSKEQQQSLADAAEGDSSAQGDGGDENSDDQILGEVDDETRAALAAMGVKVPEKKKPKPPPAFAVKPAPIQEDALFAPFVAMATKLPLMPSKLIAALEGGGGPTPLTLPFLLALVEETSGATHETNLKKTLGNTLAAFKWLFPSASK